MKKILLFSFLLLFVSASFAAEPYLISFQGKLDPVLTSPTIIFELFSDSGAIQSTGWTETHSGVDVDANGIFNVFLGNTSPLEEVILSNTAGLWLKITVGGTALTPAQALTAAPFAFVAKNLKGGVVDAFKDTAGGSAIFGRAVGSNSSGVRGESAIYHGVYGKAESDGMIGVVGESTGVGGIGVAGGSADGIGVKGVSLGTDTVGVYGENQGDGYGVMGESSGGSGVYGISYTAGGYGVHGQNNSGYGVYGYSQTGGIEEYAGVYGEGANSIGVKGIGHSGHGPGVYGYNDNNEIGHFGVYGKSDHSHGVGGTAFDPNRAGVFGENNAANGYGVHGASVNGIGVYGTGEVIAGKFVSSNGNAIVAESTSGFGVHGSSVSGIGVYGAGEVIAGKFVSSNGNAIVAESTSGDAIYSESETGRAIVAESTSGDAIYSGSETGTAIYAKSVTGNAIFATNESASVPTIHIANNVATIPNQPENHGTALFIEKGKIKTSVKDDTSQALGGQQPDGAVTGVVEIRIDSTSPSERIYNRYITGNSQIFFSLKPEPFKYPPSIFLSAIGVDSTNGGYFRIGWGPTVAQNRGAYKVCYIVIN